MRLTWLADRLREAWPLVEEHPGWENRTLRSYVYYRPKGIINHHTAGSLILHNYPGPPYWPNDRLETKCNVTIKPNGVIAVLNSGWAYDSGNGAPEVYDAVVNDQPLPPLSGLKSTKGGNAHFIDAEVQHLGDGSPIVPIQREALITFNAVVCKEMGWDPRYRVIGHLEWAPDRKVDPRWDGRQNPMPGIREDTEKAMLTETQVRQIFREELVEALGGSRIEIPNVDDEPFQRFGNQGIVNSVWHANTKGVKLFTILNRIYGYTQQLVGDQQELLDVDEEAIAAAVLAGLSPDKIADALEAQAGDILDAVRQELNERLRG